MKTNKEISWICPCCNQTVRRRRKKRKNTENEIELIAKDGIEKIKRNEE
jgi:hypothetical protein